MTTEVKPCPHKLLKRQNWSHDNPHYVCSECEEKFLMEPWDGKMEAVESKL